MDSYMCNYNFIFIFLYKYDDDNTMQNSICTFIILFKSKLNYWNKYNYNYMTIHNWIGVIIQHRILFKRTWHNFICIYTRVYLQLYE